MTTRIHKHMGKFKLLFPGVFFSGNGPDPSPTRKKKMPSPIQGVKRGASLHPHGFPKRATRVSTTSQVSRKTLANPRFENTPKAITNLTLGRPFSFAFYVISQNDTSKTMQKNN